MRVRRSFLTAILCLGALSTLARGGPPEAPKAPADKDEAARLGRLGERLRLYAKYRETLTTRCGACLGLGRIRNPIVSRYDPNLKTEITCTSCLGTCVRVSSGSLSKVVLGFRSPKSSAREGDVDMKALVAHYQENPALLNSLKPLSYQVVDVVLLPPNLGRGVIRRNDGPDEEQRFIWATAATGSGSEWYFFDPRVDDVWPFPSLFVRAGRFPIESEYDRFDDVTRHFVNVPVTDLPDHRLSAVWGHAGKTPTTRPPVIRLFVVHTGPDWKYAKMHAVAAIVDGERIPIGEGSYDAERGEDGKNRESVLFEVPTETFVRMAGAARELVFRVGMQEIAIGEEERLALKELAVGFPKEPVPPK